MWRSKLLLESSITCSQEDHTMCPKQLRATFRTVSYVKATGAKSVQSSSGTTFMASHFIYIFYFYNTYNKFNGEAKVAKERVEAVEPEKNLITFRVVEGDLMKEYKSFVITIQVTPKHGGPGSVVHWYLEYEKISDEVAHPETLLQFCVEISREIDEHLLNEE
ncbi:unnamed protein product [Brassica rapa subsp. trilocularis]